MGFSGGSEIVVDLILDSHIGKRIGDGKRGININKKTVDLLLQFKGLCGDEIRAHLFDFLGSVLHTDPFW